MKEELKNKVKKVKENLDNILSLINSKITLSERINKGINKIEKDNQENNIINIFSYISKISQVKKQMEKLLEEELKSLKFWYIKDENIIKYEDFHFSEYERSVILKKSIDKQKQEVPIQNELNMENLSKEKPKSKIEKEKTIEKENNSQVEPLKNEEKEETQKLTEEKTQETKQEKNIVSDKEELIKEELSTQINKEEIEENEEIDDSEGEYEKEDKNYDNYTKEEEVEFDENNENKQPENNDLLIDEFNKEGQNVSEEMTKDNYESQFALNQSLDQSLNKPMSFSERFLLSKSMEEDKPQEGPNQQRTMNDMKDYNYSFIYILDFLTFNEMVQFTGIHRGFKTERAFLFDIKREEVISYLELDENESLEDHIDKFKYKY